MPKFRARPTNRAQQLRSNATDAERHLWRRLSRRQLEGFKFSRQMPVGAFICDFMCRERRLIVEVDGGQHADSDRDIRRTAFLEAQGYQVVRFWNNDVLENVDGVLQVIVVALKKVPTPLSPPACGRGG
jgi:very-short-patch-repair endonuclease